MGKIKLLAAGLTTIFLLAGCAEPVVFSEVFQLTQDQKLYTKYNIWYDNPDEISSLNIQRGTFIPIGTEIEPVETTWWKDKICFRDVKTGKKFTILFNQGYRLCTMRDFIAYTFTTDNREKLLEGIPEKVKARIIRGEVVPGMDQKAVILAYGPPPKMRTPDLRNETWFYWRTESESVRLVFRDDKVRNILNLSHGL